MRRNWRRSAKDRHEKLDPFNAIPLTASCHHPLLQEAAEAARALADAEAAVKLAEASGDAASLRVAEANRARLQQDHSREEAEAEAAAEEAARERREAVEAQLDHTRNPDPASFCIVLTQAHPNPTPARPRRPSPKQRLRKQPSRPRRRPSHTTASQIRPRTAKPSGKPCSNGKIPQHRAQCRHPTKA